MGNFVEGCACFASFFAKQALDYGGKKCNYFGYSANNNIATHSALLADRLQ